MALIGYRATQHKRPMAYHVTSGIREWDESRPDPTSSGYGRMTKLQGLASPVMGRLDVH